MDVWKVADLQERITMLETQTPHKIDRDALLLFFNNQEDIKPGNIRLLLGEYAKEKYKLGSHFKVGILFPGYYM